jgi:MFS family permease
MDRPDGRVLPLLSASYAVSFFDRALVAVAGAPIKGDLHLTDVQFSILQGMAFALPYCLGALPLGWLADRGDRRQVLALGLLLWSVMTAICGLAPNRTVFFGARMGVGLGEACLLPAGMPLLNGTVSSQRLGRAVATFLLGATAGNVLAHLAGGQILLCLDKAGWPPWRSLFLLASLPGLVLAGLVLTIRKQPVSASDVAAGRRLGATFRHLWAHAGEYGWLTLSTASSVTLSQAQAAWLPQLFVRHFGLSAGRAAWMVGLMTLVSAPLGQWSGGLILDRLRTLGVPTVSNRLLAAGGALCLGPAIVFCLADSLPVAVGAYTVFNALVFATTPAGLFGWQQLAPEAHRGAIIALLSSFVSLVGLALGPLVVGILTDRVFHDERALGPALLILISIAAAGCCIAAVADRRRADGAEPTQQEAVNARVATVLDSRRPSD